MTLWLIGMMGTGKSTAGQIAAEVLDIPFFDTDNEVAAGLGGPVARVWDEFGETGFRVSESEVIHRLAGEMAIVSTGSGAILDEANRARMRASGVVDWLRCRPEVLASRLSGSAGRPLLDGEPDPAKTLAAILESRSTAYSETAHHEIETSSLSVEEVAERVVSLWPS